MKMTKRLGYMLMALALVLGVTGCNRDEEAKAADSKDAECCGCGGAEKAAEKPAE